MALVFILACSMLMTMTVCVSAKSKQLKKPGITVCSNLSSACSHPNTTECYITRNGAKKVEIYSSPTK